MKTNSITRLLSRILALSLLAINVAMAGAPLWIFTPLTPTTLSVPANSTDTVQYRVTNQSNKVHVLSLQPISAVTQLTSGTGVCGNPAVLPGKGSCVLSLQIDGSAITSPMTGGPTLCEQGSTLQCYQPSSSDILMISQAPAITDATISINGSPLTLVTNGATGTLTVTNQSLIVAATNVTSNFTDTALDGNVTETGNTCAHIAPQGTCTLTYTPGSTVVPETNFPIQGDNTNTVTAAIGIESGLTVTNVNPASGPQSGGTGVTITGTGFTAISTVTFSGQNASSVNVVDSTTITAVTPGIPADSLGPVDVVVQTGGDSATLANGFTYLATAIGQSAYGGAIACLNVGVGNLLIAATADIPLPLAWGSISVNTGATSTTDGASNTTAIISATGQTTPNAAQACSVYQVDSLGNTPCEAGNTCYSDWFLPAGNNTSAQGQLNCLYENKDDIGGFSNNTYWSSTQVNTNVAYAQNFSLGNESTPIKSISALVRCVRSFNP